MKICLHLIALGVGASIALVNSEVSYAKPSSDLADPQLPLTRLPNWLPRSTSSASRTLENLTLRSVPVTAVPSELRSALIAPLPVASPTLSRPIAASLSSTVSPTGSMVKSNRLIAMNESSPTGFAQSAAAANSVVVDVVAEAAAAQSSKLPISTERKFEGTASTARPIANATPSLQAQPPKPKQTTPLPPSTAPRSGGSTRPTSPKPAAPKPAAPQPAAAPTPGSAPTSVPLPTIPTPRPTPTSGATSGKNIAVPEQLNPSPNPLLFPTRPGEVTLQEAQPISLAQAIELAERNNRDLQIARLQVEQGQAALRESRAAYLPTLSFQTGLNRSGSNVGSSTGSGTSFGTGAGTTGLGTGTTGTGTTGTTGTGTTGTTGTGTTGTTGTGTTGTTGTGTTGTTGTGTTSGTTPSGTTAVPTANPTAALTAAEAAGLTSSSASRVRTSLSGSLQLSYDLYTSGLRNANLRTAERQLRSTELALERTREQLRLDVTGDYYDLQDADEQVRINAAAVANAQANLNDSLAQERAGLGTRFDTLRAQVNLANAQQQFTNAIATQIVRRRQLSQRLSLSETTNVVASDPVDLAGTWTLPLADSIVLAYKNRTELEEQLVARDISEQQRRAVLSANGPTVRATAQYGFNQEFGRGASTSDQYAFALQANWSLFDGGATSARALQREKDKQIAETRFAQNRNAIRFQVEQSYTNLQANLANVRTTEQAVTQALEAQRLAVLRVQAGVGTQTDRINAETELTRARGNRVSAILGYNRSLAQLRRAVSNLTR